MSKWDPSKNKFFQLAAVSLLHIVAWGLLVLCWVGFISAVMFGFYLLARLVGIA